MRNDVHFFSAQCVNSKYCLTMIRVSINLDFTYIQIDREIRWICMLLELHVFPYHRLGTIDIQNIHCPFFLNCVTNSVGHFFIESFSDVDIYVSHAICKRNMNAIYVWHMYSLSNITHLPGLLAPLQWYQNERNSVSNHRRIGCLLNRLFQA